MLFSNICDRTHSPIENNFLRFKIKVHSALQQEDEKHYFNNGFCGEIVTQIKYESLLSSKCLVYAPAWPSCCQISFISLLTILQPYVARVSELTTGRE